MSLRQGAIAVALVLSVLTAACSDSKVSQCNRLIGVANRAVDEVQAVAQNATSPEDIEAFLAIADQIAANRDQAAAEVRAIELTDQQLLSYRQRFITMYTDASEVTRDLTTALKEQDFAASEQAFNALQAVTEREQPLVNEVNAYCSSAQE